MSELREVAFDPYSHELQEDPYPVYKRLRDEHPLYHVEHRGFWVVSRYADCRAVLKRHDAFTSTEGNLIDDAKERVGRTLGTTDPPRHDELRATVSKAFSPKFVTSLEPMIRRRTTELLAPLRDGEPLDVVREFSGPLTLGVIGEMLGVPESEQRQLQEWREKTVHRDPDRMGFTPAGEQAFRESLDYMRSLVAERAREPRSDLISELIRYSDDDDPEAPPLSREEIAVTSLTMVAAALESTKNMVANAVAVLAEHPDARAEVAADPGLLPAALEETIRYDSATQGFARTATEDYEVGGGVIPRGDRVLVLLGSGNRDERCFDDPDRFDIHRGDVRRHLGFGSGIHFCLGAPLARLEARVAFEELLATAPEYVVLEEGAGRIHSPTFRGYRQLFIERAAR